MIDLEEPARFNLCPTYMPRETAQGYLGRITAFFSEPTPKHFCRDYMLDLKGIQHGEPDALQRLAAMVGADADEMIRCTPKRIDNAFMELNDEVLHTRVNPRYQIRICPVCAKEDIATNVGMPIDQAVYMRCEWTVGVVDVCHRHGVKLMTYAAPYRTVEKFDIGYETVNLLEQLNAIETEAGELDDFQLYVLGRVGAVAPRSAPLLDSLPLVTATQVCVALGLDRIRHDDPKAAPSDVQRRAAGFEMLGHDAEHFERQFCEMRSGMKIADMATKFIPRLLEYLHDSEGLGRDLDALKDMVADVCFRNLPYAPGTVLLGRFCPKRWLYDFNEAILALGVPQHHLHAFVLGTPGLAAFVGKRRQDSMINADFAHAFFAGRTPFIANAEAGRLLGVLKGHEARLLAEVHAMGIVSAAAGASSQEIPPIYSLPELKASVEAFVAGLETFDPSTADMRPIRQIAMTTRIGYAEIWRLLARRELRRVVVGSQEGLLSSLLIDFREVLQVIYCIPDPLTMREAAKQLGLNDFKAYALVKEGLLCAATKRDDVPNTPLIVLSAREVERFNAMFMTNAAVKSALLEITGQWRPHRHGLLPAFNFEFPESTQNSLTLYRRDAVTAVLERLS